MRALTSDPDRVVTVADGEDVRNQDWFERLLDRGATECALGRRERARRREPLDLLRLDRVYRRVSGTWVSTAASAARAPAVTTRGGLACIWSWRSSSASRAVRRLSRSRRLGHQACVGPPWASCRPARSPGRPSALEDEAVALLIQAALDLVAYPVKLGLAARLHLAQEGRQLVGDNQLAALLSAAASRRQGAGRDDLTRERCGNTIEVRRRPRRLHSAALVDIGVAETTRDRGVRRIGDLVDDPDEQTRLLAAGRSAPCRDRASGASASPSRW